MTHLSSSGRASLDVSFQEVVHWERIEETGVTTPQLSRIAPNEHPRST